MLFTIFVDHPRSLYDKLPNERFTFRLQTEKQNAIELNRSTHFPSSSHITGEKNVSRMHSWVQQHRDSMIS